VGWQDFRQPGWKMGYANENATHRFMMRGIAIYFGCKCQSGESMLAFRRSPAECKLDGLRHEFGI